MSTEVHTRQPASRGRSTTRGGRGSYASRSGPRGGNRHTNGDSKNAVPDETDLGELGELKKQYSSQLSMLKEMFPDWADVDLLFAVQETDGDLQRTIDHITEGNVSQFAEIKKKTKDRARSKAKESSAAAPDASSSRPSRGRGGLDSSRAGRGRGDRGGRGGFRGSRGGAHATTNGTRTIGQPSVPTTESSAWDTPQTEAGGDWDKSVPAATAEANDQSAAPEAQKPAPVPAAVPKKTWAQMFAQPKPAPIPAKKAAEAPQVPDVGLPPPSEDITAPEEQVEAAIETEALSIPPVADEAAPDEPIAETTEPSISTPDITEDTAALDLTPSKDELTVDNVEHLPDSSHPVVSETVASTVASTRDAGSTLSAITPSIPLQQQPPIGRPPMGGYATTAYKATATPGTRSASYQRRLLEQQEAVVLPGNHAIDKVGVQFGSMGLNGDLDSDTLDVDEDREEAETRTQPPQHSPTQQPRASLPPVPRQPSAPTEAPQPETLPTPKAAPGLPSVPQQHPPPQQAAQSSPPAPLGSQVMSQQGSQGAHPYSQFGRYGQPNPTDASAPSQKPYDPFGHQAAQSNQFEGFPGQSSAQSQQPQNHSQQGAFSSAPSDYSSYYTSEQQRNAYSNYYGHNYNQQGASGQNDSAPSQQRVGSAFSAAPGDSSYPTSQPQQSQSRYSEAQNSGHTTPNPLVGGQTQTGAQSQQAQHIGQQPHGHNSGQHFGGYGAQPYFNNPQQYYNAYMNQYGYGQGGYGGGPFGAGKGGIYGQPHQYGMSPHAGYDQHSSSPANAAAFTQSSLHGRDSALGGALGDYGRSGSAQPSQSQQHGTASGFGGMHDVFGSRGQGGFPSQSQGYGQQQSGQQSGNEDSLKPFGDTKATAGPSPSLGQPHRPSSATNTAPGQGAQSGLPPQSHQQGFGGYPGGLHNNQGSQYGGLGGLGHQGGSQGQGYGGGYGGFGGTYGSYGSRGGWGSNYPNH